MSEARITFHYDGDEILAVSRTYAPSKGDLIYINNTLYSVESVCWEYSESVDTQDKVQVGLVLDTEYT